eukprot:TRINITY_DN32461_c0_g1_i1.p1 TRINITY_DN32461_c0_g1~~TRINITY_DN32461_c0_g1_i1.p1  ORF type:complete len:161 (-),score=33.16 TRINITY_DN32461_c0_g1_i1:216-674(-)
MGIVSTSEYKRRVRRIIGSQGVLEEEEEDNNSCIVNSAIYKLKLVQFLNRFTNGKDFFVSDHRVGQTFIISYPKTELDFYLSDHRVGQDLCQSKASVEQEVYLTDHTVSQEFCRINPKSRHNVCDAENESKTGYEIAFFMTDHRAGQDLFGY